MSEESFDDTNKAFENEKDIILEKIVKDENNLNNCSNMINMDDVENMKKELYVLHKKDEEIENNVDCFSGDKYNVENVINLKKKKKRMRIQILHTIKQH